MANRIPTLLLAASLAWLTPQLGVRPALAQPTSQSEGWNGVTWGMSIEQVATVFPSVRPAAVDADGNPQLVLTDFQDGTQVFDVYFAFDNGALCNIQLLWN